MTDGSAVRATRLGPAFDLLAAYEDGGVFFERDGLGVAAGWGGGALEPPVVTTSSGDFPSCACALKAACSCIMVNAAGMPFPDTSATTHPMCPPESGTQS